MKMFERLTKGLAILVAGVALASAAVAQTKKDTDPITDEVKTEVLERLERSITTQAFVPGVDFKGWSAKIEANQARLDSAKTTGQFAAVVNSLMREYGFSHISLFTPSFGEARVTQKRAGIGIRIQVEENGLRVVNVFPDSPAGDVGLMIGDLVIENDGKPVRSVADLAGNEGDKSTIVVLRGEERITKDVVRRQYSTIIPESLEWDGDVAIVTVPTFDTGYNPSNVEDIMVEAKKRAKAVVLDLRGNGGGRVTNLQHLAAFFLDYRNEPMGTFVGRRDVANFEKAQGKTSDVALIAQSVRGKVRSSRGVDLMKKLDVPVAVLVDGGSGSASEIMAMALREHKSAPLIGSTSAGAVLASLVIKLEEKAGYYLQYPVLDYVSINGYRIEGNGLKPDVVAGPVRFGEPDQGRVAAISELRKIASGATGEGDGSKVDKSTDGSPEAA